VLAACYRIYFQTWSVIFVIGLQIDSRLFIITNKGLTQSVNEPITFLTVFNITEICSANLTVNGSVDWLTDWLINPIKLFSRAYNVNISDDLYVNGLEFAFFVIRFYFAFNVFYCTPLLSIFCRVRYANLVDWLTDRYISSVFIVKQKITKPQQY